MVVMEAAASVCGEAGGQAQPPPTSPTTSAANHRWYDQSGSTAGGNTGTSSSSEQLDAYFKGSNATTAAYFSQMQAGAYPGMSYHGNFIARFC